ncbi:hypothetical protein ACN4EK_00955 [Pantanalinema rosaneae CENA516]|uniref:hypothetical protein n=1 Tax=Pantanalinema rosaneae TaxID=1620701 RepID=UPI003D6FBAAC
MNSQSLPNLLSSQKLLPLMAGAVAIALAIGSAIPVGAQSTTPNTPNNSTERPQRPKPNVLNLTSQQQEQMKQIMESSRTQIDAILTAEQKAQLQAAKANRPNFRPDGNGSRPNLTAEQKAQLRANRGDRRGPGGGFASLNLTAEQKAQIDAVMQSTKAQMDAVLTPEQRQQKQQFEQQYQQRRQSRGQRPQFSQSRNN